MPAGRRGAAARESASRFPDRLREIHPDEPGEPEKFLIHRDLC
jgi:hypothetical protein